MENQNPPFPPPPNNPFPPPGNPYQQNPMGNGPMGMQPDLPNHVGVLVLGICSIVFCWCYGIVGLICGIISLVLASKASSLYNSNPNAYSLKSFNNMKAGRICAIIGTSLSILTMLYFIIVIIFFGSLSYNSSFPWQRF
jgi:hypothetical protein